MSHDELIARLSGKLTSVKPVRVDQYVVRVFGLWLCIVSVIVIAVGLREDFGHIASIIKPAFFIGYALLLSATLFLGALPGRRARHWFVASMLLLGVGASLVVHRLYYGGLAVLDDALSQPAALLCLLSISMLSLVPLYWTLRWAKMAAPSRPVRTGMLAGAISGTLAASAYGLQCQQDAVVYIGIWYSSPVLLYTAIGALLGHRLLRW